MADNYLEKKMADYRAGRGSAGSRRPGGLRLSPVTVLLDVVDAELAAELCRVLTSVGYKVLATAATGIPLGAGARVYPATSTPETLMADLESRGEKLDAVVSETPSEWTGIAPRRVYLTKQDPDFKPGPYEVVVVGGSPQQQSLLAIALVRPDCGVNQQYIASI